MTRWNVIWQVDPDDLGSCIEKVWFDEITALVPKGTATVDYQTKPLLSASAPQAIVCASCPNQTSPSELSRYLDHLPGPTVLYHMSDEYLEVGEEVYGHCDLVIRNGSAAFDISSPLVQIPLGYAAGLHNSSGAFTKASRRTYSYAFLGMEKHERESEMLPALRRISGQSFIRKTGSWSEAMSFFGDGSVDVYKDTVFVPNPKGNWSPECNRLYDALEWGCIPLSRRYRDSAYHETYFERLLGDNPIPTFDDWPAAADFANRLLSSGDGELDALQAKLSDWWRAYKIELQRKVAERLAALVT
ncbi:MAG: hypothetical protein R3D30_10955 [Hyphomicrobiales bacterium]